MINVKAEEKKLTIKIYSEISDDTYYYSDSEDSEEKDSVKNVKQLDEILKKNKDVGLIDIYINSPGGSVFEGLGIYNILKRSRAYKRVYIDGFACSVASVIAMAGNAIYMPKSSMMMIHNAWAICAGNANDFRKMADDLDKINETIVAAYMTKFQKSEKELKSYMDAESYLTAAECLKLGLCTKIVEDSEDTEEDAENGIDSAVNMYSAKLNQLETIKGLIRNLNAETIANEAEEASDAEADKVNEAEGEMDKPENPVSAENVKEKVEEVKASALQRFFHVNERKEEK